jgi:hypothetical protein
MKLLDIINELDKPKKIYADRKSGEETNVGNLNPDELDTLFKQGSVLVPLPSDPNRPETTKSQVVNLPKIDQIRKDVLSNKKEFDMFLYSRDEDIKDVAKKINRLHNDLFKAMTALDKMIALKKSGRI